MLPENKSLYVVRGAYNGLDPTFACASNTAERGKYVAIEVDSEAGGVTKRTLQSDKNAVEDMMQQYRAVYVDSRTDPHLLSKPHCEHAEAADLDLFRRAKSDDELDQLTELSRSTRELLNNDGIDANTFRGTAYKLGHRAYFSVYRGAGFTEYRGGMQDELGRVSDETKVVPTNEDWRDRMERVNNGLMHVERVAKVGMSTKELDDIFRGYLIPEKDFVKSPCIHSRGYQSIEDLSNFDHLQPYDFVMIGATVSDGKDDALVYRSTKQILPIEIKEATREPLPEPLPEPPLHTKYNFRGYSYNDAFVYHHLGMEDGMHALTQAFM